jgi:hypothetical protein
MDYYWNSYTHKRTADSPVLGLIQNIRKSYVWGRFFKYVKFIENFINLDSFFFCFGVGGKIPLLGQISKSNTTTHASGRVCNSSKLLVPDITQHLKQTNLHDSGVIRTQISAGEQPQSYALDRAATGTGN